MTERKISAGSYDLNKWLFGGYENDVITMIAGPAGSGKSNFCILAAVSQAKHGNKVIFVDTEGGFSVERARQIAGEDCEKILESILLMKPVNFEEQKKTFSKLLSTLKDNDKVRLIIVDGMTMLYRLEMGDARQEESDSNVQDVNRELAKQMRILAEISRKQEIPVLITNQVYSEFLSEEDLRKGVKKGVNFVGGDLLKYWSKCIIELQNENGKRTAVLRKHRSLPEKEFSFAITNEGIKKKGWM
ncbi:MAG: DNA repair and recombination protein RadB [Nanoarchaeota archaeon]|nr:DNA repair and recombination protein RadB [Nanoarchaeota archaeon]